MMDLHCKKILLIGAGELGSRHLQSLAQIDFDTHIEVIDPNEKSLQVSENRYREMPMNPFVKTIDFNTHLCDKDEIIDLAVIATGANVRLMVLKDLLSKKKVKNLILEKVLFQSVEQLDEAQKLIDAHQVKTWVNCPKRLFDGALQIKKILANAESFKVKVEGDNWGLLCNSVHFLDLTSFWSNEIDYQIDLTQMKHEIVPSKRAGFVEMFGAIIAKFSHRACIELSCQHSDQFSFNLSVETKENEIHWSEKNSQLIVKNLTNNTIAELVVKSMYQSQMTHKLAKEIIFNGSCLLPDYASAARIHRPFLQSLLSLYNKITHENKGLLTIT